MGSVGRYLWAAPASALGLLFVPLALVSGGRISVVDGVLEVSGGLVRRMLRGHLFVVGSASALTLGHVVLGQNDACLAASRSHERIHVAQYERWGPLMIPLYLLSSLDAWRRGLHPYVDNVFEREAFDNE